MKDLSNFGLELVCDSQVYLSRIFDDSVQLSLGLSHGLETAMHTCALRCCKSL